MRADSIAEALRDLRQFETSVGNTELRELEKVGVANDNRLFAKLEYLNPSGSLYDRVYVKLLREHLNRGSICPGVTRLVETTSGNAGTSIAHIARRLNFPVTVILPADTPDARRQTIENLGAELVLSPPGKYVRGAVMELREYLTNHKGEVRRGELFPLNHSRNLLSVVAVEPIADEIVRQLAKRGLAPDILVLGCGNGTTILGIGGRLKTLVPLAQVLAFDPVEAPVAFERKWPGRLAALGRQSLHGPHRIVGTGGSGVHFPFIQDARFNEVVDDVALVSDSEMTAALQLVEVREHIHPGFSSAAAVAVALKIGQEVRGKTIVVVFYDQRSLYH